jgi:hypothetical protein
MPNTGRKLLSFTLLAVLASAAGADQPVYRWIDAHGQVHFGDRPPPGASDLETLRQPRIASQGDATGSKPEPIPATPVPVEARPADEPIAAVYEPAPLRNPAACQRARDNLWQIDNSARVRVIEPDGEYRFLTPEEKAQERLESLRVIEVHCR